MTWPRPGPPASWARCMPRPPCWACPRWPTRGYNGAGAGVLTPTKGHGLHPDNLARNQLIGCLRAQGERGIALLKTRWKALNRIRLCPQRIGAITKAALVLTRAERPIR